MNRKTPCLSNFKNIKYNITMLSSFSEFQSHNTNEKLSCDEALLRYIEKNQDHKGFLRFWESNTYDIVLGASNKVKQEVNNNTQSSYTLCRRCSGGGTVLQGPGCLNYVFILPLSYDPKLANLSSTNCFIMTLVKDTINDFFSSQHLHLKSDINRHTDLSIKILSFQEMLNDVFKNQCYFMEPYFMTLI